ncbi:Phosphatidylserine decarboxylase proenzyme [Trichinella pseudospiralis]
MCMRKGRSISVHQSAPTEMVHIILYIRNGSIWSCGNCTVEHLSGQHLTNLFARNDRWPIMCIFVCSSCQTADHNRPHFIHRCAFL